MEIETVRGSDWVASVIKAQKATMSKGKVKSAQPRAICKSGIN